MMKKMLFVAVALVRCQVAMAEDYVQAGYGSVRLKDDTFGVTFSGYDWSLSGRYDVSDLKVLPVFVTAGFHTGSVDNSDFGFTITNDVKGYQLGAGYAWTPSPNSEVYASAKYAHDDIDQSVPGGTTSGTSDGATLALGGHIWLNDVFKVYGDIGYDSFSHSTTGHGFDVGVEAAIASTLRLFIEYNYGYSKDKSSSPTDITKTGIIGGGIKIPFGGRR